MQHHVLDELCIHMSVPEKVPHVGRTCLDEQVPYRNRVDAAGPPRVLYVVDVQQQPLDSQCRKRAANLILLETCFVMISFLVPTRSSPWVGPQRSCLANIYASSGDLRSLGSKGAFVIPGV